MNCLLSPNPSLGGPWSSKTSHLPRPADAAAERPGKVGRKRQVGGVGQNSKLEYFSSGLKNQELQALNFAVQRDLSARYIIRQFFFTIGIWQVKKVDIELSKLGSDLLAQVWNHMGPT